MEDVNYIARFRQGTGPMSMSAVDFYKDKKGRIICHSWAMGGESKKKVTTVPESIPGYRLIPNT